ncbi:unnamed protein product [Caenorhabditis sp. 36 PRJEB53466]|nr:unnamed protein product [Caenorhabditis sp. 36 PRJEB53466]
MAIFSVGLLFFLFFLVFLYFSRKKHYRIREKIGLKGPETHWLLGNLNGFIERKTKIGHDDAYDWFIELHEKYGETFGFFVGRQLDIIISNEEDIKEVLVKNFSNFSDRKEPEYMEGSSLSKSLFFSRYATGWKHSRVAISPIFSSGSMKAMFATVELKVDVFLNVLKEKSQRGERFDILEDFQALTLDVIAKCAFAIDSSCQTDRSDLFYVQAKEFVKNIDYRESWITTSGLFLQEFGSVWKYLYRFSGMAKPEKPLVQGLYDLYQRRMRGESSESVDLLNLMIQRNKRKQNADQKISEEEIVGNCFAVLLGGYDTSSTALTFLIYLLSKHPDVQEKLFEEIQNVKETCGINHDSIFGMKYLDAVYKESLRLYPPVYHAIVRVCLNDITIRNQFIPKGSCVTTMPYTVHRNEENWKNSNEFVPERFLDWNEKSSLKWIPFGVGPRICVGMRFAEMEIKTTVVRMMEKFEMSVDSEQPEMITECDGIVMKPKDPVFIQLNER